MDQLVGQRRSFTELWSLLAFKLLSLPSPTPDWSNDQADQIKTDQIKTDQIKTDQIRTDQIKAISIKSFPVG
jgi:hypothetical protein